MTDQERIAAFLAKGGKVTVAAPAPAYGVDPALDKITRRARRDVAGYECSERAAETRQQRAVEENGYYKS